MRGSENVLYTCCQCNVVNRWATSRCVSVLSDGIVCGHHRGERHCEVFKVNPRRDDGYLSQGPFLAGPSSLRIPGIQSCPIVPSLPALEDADSLQTRSEAIHQSAVGPGYGRDESQADSVQALRGGRMGMIGSDSTEAEVTEDKFHRKSFSQVFSGTKGVDVPKDADSHLLSGGEQECESTTAAGANHDTNQPTRQRGNSLRRGRGRSSVSRRNTGGRPLSKGRDRPRVMYGTCTFNVAKDCPMLACPYEKFSPQSSDCCSFFCEKEGTLQREHLPLHRDTGDISGEECDRISIARNFLPGEYSGFTEPMKGLRHWQKRFVAIYPEFEFVEHQLRAEKGLPLLEDANVLSQLRHRQLKSFEEGGLPFPYAYLPQRDLLRRKNSEHDLQGVFNSILADIEAHGSSRGINEPTYEVSTEEPEPVEMETISESLAHLDDNSKGSAMLSEPLASSAASSPSSESSATVRGAEDLDDSDTPQSQGRSEADSIFTTTVDWWATPDSMYTLDANESSTPNTEPGSGLSPPIQRATIRGKAAQASFKTQAESIAPFQRRFRDWVPSAEMCPPLNDLNNLFNGPPDPEMFASEGEDEISELLRMKAQEDILEAWRRREEDRTPDSGEPFEWREESA